MPPPARRVDCGTLGVQFERDGRCGSSVLSSHHSGQNPAEPRTIPTPDGSPAAQEHGKGNGRHRCSSLRDIPLISLIPPSPYIPRTALGIPPPFPPLHEKKGNNNSNKRLTQDGATLRDVVRKSCLTTTPHHPTLDNSQERPRWQWVWTTTVAVM
jgi:hypothetical protein